MKVKKSFVPVSERALIQRLNRVLDKDGEIVKKNRSARALHELGTYYVVSFEGAGIVAKDIDLESYGRELKVLADWEKLSE